MHDIQAVILAAGEGKRMHPLTYTRPKVMLPVANKPILEHLLLEMQKAGIRDFIFIVGYHAEKIRDYFGAGDKWQVRIQYRSQLKQEGTADALRTVADLVNGPLILANGDTVVNSGDILRLLSSQDNVLSAIEKEDVSGLGVFEVQADKVLRIHEKTAVPPSHLANAGLYLFTPEIFSAISRTPRSTRGEFEITDSIQILIDSGRPVSWMALASWLDLSYPWDLLTANEVILNDLKPRVFGKVEDRVTLKGSVSIGRNTLVRSGAYIVGPVVIGDNCDIGPNCFIRAATAIADRCHVGASVELKNSILMSGTKVPHLSYVGDTIIGENCNLGAGTKIANLRIDKRNISAGGIDTHRRKLGAIIGDDVQTGINASLNVGALVGNGALIGPGALAAGVIAPGARIF